MLANFVSAQNATENSSTTAINDTVPSSAATAPPSAVHLATDGGSGGVPGVGSRIVVQQNSGGGSAGGASSSSNSRGCTVSGGELSHLLVGSGCVVNKGMPSNTTGGTDNNNSSGGGGVKECGNDDNSAEAKQSSSMSPFSMPGVLHFLQQEWGRYELDRAQWEIERSELKARISFLIGERKSQENLKHDLVRRIKMLEYALKQERAKFQQLIDAQENNDKTAINLGEENDEKQDCGAEDGTKSSVPFEIDALLPPPPSSAVSNNNNNSATGGGVGAKNAAGIVPSAPPSSVPSDQAWAHARETLRHYLQEIGYTEHMLEARCFRVKQLLGVHQQPAGGGVDNKNNAVANNTNFSGDSANDVQQQLAAMAEKHKCRGDGGGGAGSAVAKLRKEILWMNDEEEENQQQRQQQGGGSKNSEGQKLGIDWKKRRAGDGGGAAAAAAKLQTEMLSMDNESSEGGGGGGGAVRDIGDDVEKFADIKSGFEDDDDDTVQQMRWTNQFTLRSHYDCVRAMQFHPVEPMLITASEDGTAKLWDLNHSSVVGAKHEGGGAGGGTKTGQSGTGILDIEPLYTFRGHRGPILALDLAPLGETFYTSGLDGTICCWTVPQTFGLDTYQTFDPSVLQERLVGHTDAVWCLCFHAASNRLISASADGTIRIWIVGLADGAMPSPLLKTIKMSADDEASGGGGIIRPHSIDLVSTTDRQQLLCAYQGGGGGGGSRQCFCNIRDLETGQVVVNFQLDGGDDQPSALNKILSHPTMPVSIAAGEDRKIRFFDNNTGKLISAPMAHVEGVSTLAIDPNGLYMLSGSHDGSMRLWNAEKRVCLQEIAAHRKKFGAGVMAVAFHPSRQLIGSSGADSLAKVYSPIRQSPRSSVVAAFGASPSSSPGSSGPSSVVGSPQKSSPISSAAAPTAAKSK